MALVVIGVARGSSPEPVEVDSAGAAVMVGLFGLALLTPFIALVVVDVVLAVSRNRAVLVWHAVVGGVGFVATLGAVADHPWLLLVFVAFAAVACFGIAGFAATTPRARRARIVPAVRAR